MRSAKRAKSVYFLSALPPQEFRHLHLICFYPCIWNSKPWSRETRPFLDESLFLDERKEEND